VICGVVLTESPGRRSRAVIEAMYDSAYRNGGDWVDVSGEPQ